jgi:hypothetical protein
MAGGEHRPEQQEMCRAVAEALATGTHLVVQAGTGNGKSLGLPGAGRTQRPKGRGWPPPQRLCRTDAPYHRLGDVGEGPYGASGMASRRAWSE